MGMVALNAQLFQAAILRRDDEVVFGVEITNEIDALGNRWVMVIDCDWIDARTPTACRVAQLTSQTRVFETAIASLTL
jgi:hypothetical protein